MEVLRRAAAGLALVLAAVYGGRALGRLARRGPRPVLVRPAQAAAAAAWDAQRPRYEGLRGGPR